MHSIVYFLACVWYYLRRPYLPAPIAYPFWRAYFRTVDYLRYVLPLDLRIGALYARNLVRAI